MWTDSVGAILHHLGGTAEGQHRRGAAANIDYAIGLGLLASGGSGFWNSIQEYLIAVKKIRKQETPARPGGDGLATPGVIWLLSRQGHTG